MKSEEVEDFHGPIGFLARSAEFMMVLLTVAMVCLVSYQVFQRYVLKYTPPWSEELSVYLMIWFGMIGIAVGVRRDSHMALHYFADLFPAIFQKPLEIFKYVLILLYTGALLREGIAMVELTMSQTSPAMHAPVGYVYASLPFSFCLILVFAAERLIKALRKGRGE
ncbi:TRAP-type C4-dicarboxylate transport system permease small subunit [Sporomusaceae bacterium BoRhaA]|uniref:TRAP transporter small permease n=1 Tax=Pelorhabdus rhamnosifermentans TaxID=2772457 RepID=UPI001C06427F|nr:TRAP transporter small permease [Pelorhabdus rhamnosifermentans]MBU2699255.1 TRAP-type C4-dicarboxylate transport system permease small subunit [Pelorhabdus rhamnosifermentans]